MSVIEQPVLADGAEVRRLRTLYRLLAELSRARALADVYDAALTSLLEATSADRAAILLFDDAGPGNDSTIRFKASRGLSADYQAAVSGHSPWQRGAIDVRPLVIADAAGDASLAAYRGALAREGIRALTFIPLALNAGVFGKFMLYYSEPHQSTTDELEIAQAIAAHVALATEHKRAEQARTRSEQRLQTILDHSPSVIFLKDPGGRYLLVNRRFEELFHIGQKDVIGRTSNDILPPEIADRMRANDHAVLAAGKPLTFEEQAPHDDGLHTYISMKFPLAGPDGSIAGVCCIATDITERRRLEVASRHLAAIVESSDDAIVGEDLNGIITSWNRAAERIFGYTPDDVVSKPVSILADPDHRDEMPAILSRVRQGQRVEPYETRRRRKDGQIIDVALTVSPVRGADDRIVGASKIARDISDRKRTERELAELLASERDSRRIAELLNNAAPRLAAQLNPAKLLQEITDIATALVGAEIGAFIQKTVDEEGESWTPQTFSGVRREAFEGFAMSRNMDLFRPLLRGVGIVRCEDVTQDDQYGPVPPDLPVRSYLGAQVVARSGEILGGLFFGHSVIGRFTASHDAIITGIAAQAGIAMDNARLFEQARWAQTELKRSNEELRRVNRDLEVFAYSASHDLQEPLRTIAISAQLIARGGHQSQDAEGPMLLDNILSATRRMGTLIQDLLAYATAAKYEEGQAPSVDAGRVFADVVENLRGLIAEAGAMVTAGALPAVGIHEGRLAQLFQNLIGNALKYRDTSKQVPSVHVTAEDHDGWCVFSVADNGIGIEPQYAEQIFGLFKRLHGRDEYPGSGIGLAICQRVVEQYGGRIWLEQSSFGGGSTFCFSLPSRTGT